MDPYDAQEKTKYYCQVVVVFGGVVFNFHFFMDLYTLFPPATLATAPRASHHTQTEQIPLNSRPHQHTSSTGVAQKRALARM